VFAKLNEILGAKMIDDSITLEHIRSLSAAIYQNMEAETRQRRARMRTVSPITAVLRFSEYLLVSFALIGAAIYSWYLLGAYHDLGGQQTDGTAIGIFNVPFKTAGDIAVGQLSATMSASNFSIFVVLFAVGAVLCRKG
jgi:hypothetical protein